MVEEKDLEMYKPFKASKEAHDKHWKFVAKEHARLKKKYPNAKVGEYTLGKIREYEEKEKKESK